MIRVFQQMELREAIAFAAAGNQSIHLHRIIVDPSTAPQCFVDAVNRGENIAHLFDQNESRLVATVKRLGVRVVRIEKRGTDGQHVDLCGGPLRKLLSESMEILI